MKICLLCNKNDSEMEFNTPTSIGMCTANICLGCWASYPDDDSVALAILRARQAQAVSLFDLPSDIIKHWQDVPEEKRPAIRRFLLLGAGIVKDADV